MRAARVSVFSFDAGEISIRSLFLSYNASPSLFLFPPLSLSLSTASYSRALSPLTLYHSLSHSRSLSLSLSLLSEKRIGRSAAACASSAPSSSSSSWSRHSSAITIDPRYVCTLLFFLSFSFPSCAFVPTRASEREYIVRKRTAGRRGLKERDEDV